LPHVARLTKSTPYSSFIAGRDVAGGHASACLNDEQGRRWGSCVWGCFSLPLKQQTISIEGGVGVSSLHPLLQNVIIGLW